MSWTALPRLISITRELLLRSSRLVLFVFCGASGRKLYSTPYLHLNISCRSFHSTNVWMQNRRHPRDLSKKPWFLVPGAIDPAVDPKAPMFPLKGIYAQTSVRKVKKQKATNNRASISSKITQEPRDSPTRSSIPPISPIIGLNNAMAHDSATSAFSPSSGDSNGSALSTPRASPSVESMSVQVQVHQQVVGNVSFMSPEEQAASILADMLRNSSRHLSRSSPIPFIDSVYGQIPPVHDVPTVAVTSSPSLVTLDKTPSQYTKGSLSPYCSPVAARYSQSNVRTSPIDDGGVTERLHPNGVSRGHVGAHPALPHTAAAVEVSLLDWQGDPFVDCSARLSRFAS